MDALSQTGVPVVATPGTGYRLVDGYFLPPLTFSGTEAGLLMLGGTFIRDRVDPDLRHAADDALTKLAAVLPAEQQALVEQWRAELAFPRMRGSDNPYLGPIRKAIQDRRALRLAYQAYRRPQAEQRDVEPISLIFFSETWHLAAYCRTREAVRLFRLDRIDALEILDDHFAPGQRHERVRGRNDGAPDLPEARVRFDPDVVRWVRERQLFTLIREEHDLFGPVFVYAVRDADALIGWLLGWGTAAELLDPPELRERLAEHAQAVWRRHADRLASELEQCPEELLATART